MIQVCVICMVKRAPLSAMEAEYRRLLETVVSPFINTKNPFPCAPPPSSGLRSSIPLPRPRYRRTLVDMLVDAVAYRRLPQERNPLRCSEEELKPCHSYWLLCIHCKHFMQMIYNFQQTALVGVKNLKCLLHKLNTQTIEDTTPRVVAIKVEPPVSTPALKQEFVTVEAPTNIEDTTPRVVAIKVEPPVSTPALKQEFVAVEAPTNGNPLTEELHLKFERWPPESDNEPELQDCEFDSTMTCDSKTEAQNSTMTCDSNTEAQNIQHPASTVPSIQQVQIPKMDATVGSEGTFEVFTHKPQPTQKPCPSSIRRKHGVREGPRKRIRKKPSRVACPHCDKSVLDTSLRTHISRKHSDSPCTCDVCGKQCRNQVVLKSHESIHRKNTTIDDICPERYCQECALPFPTLSLYRAHLTTLKHMSRDEYQFECETCKRRFPDEKRRERHINLMHHGLRKHKCDQCDKTYGDASSLRRHVAVFHENRVKPPKHVCHLCGKSFTIRNNLAEHLLSHEGLRPHQCPLCPATFTYKAALFTHNRLKHFKIKSKLKEKKKEAEKEGKPEEKNADTND